MLIPVQCRTTSVSVAAQVLVAPLCATESNNWERAPYEANIRR
jgi:hypothetical protein